MDISVIICAHNPRPDYLRRVLDALRAQTLSVEQWELLLVDNGSKEPLAGQWDLSWHPRARHIREDELGLTPARFRGIREAAAELLAFVDDDNVLAADYLSQALALAGAHPWIGALGGSIVGEFETVPDSQFQGVLYELTLGEVQREIWACCAGVKAVDFVPPGAGMVIRKAVAKYYFEVASKDPVRRGLDRKGLSLVSAGDLDMALCACRLGQAVGRFPQLNLTHLIPSGRLTRDYLLRLVEAKHFSYVLVYFIWEGVLPDHRSANESQAKLCRSERIFKMYKDWRTRSQPARPPSFDEEVAAAKERGWTAAFKMLESQPLARG